MFGILLASLGALFEESSMVIGKKQIKARHESIYTMGFLNLFWVFLGFIGAVLLVPGSFVFSAASLPTFLPRLVLEIIQAYVTVKAVAIAGRGSFSFIRSLTIPLLIAVDVFLKYALTWQQFLGIGLIVITVLILFANHGIEKKGCGYVLFSAINAAATISLYKYDISHFNSVIAEQLMIIMALMAYFIIAALVFSHENPLRLLTKPVLFFQSLGQGMGTVVESFAYTFAPASIILAAKRASGVAWSILTGSIYFHEKHFLVKLSGFVFLAIGIVLLAL